MRFPVNKSVICTKIMWKFTVLVIILILFKKTHEFTHGCRRDCQGANITGDNKIGPPLLYHDVNSVLAFLRKPEYTNNNAVQEILAYYDRTKTKASQSITTKQSKKYPLIVLEGLAGTGKTTLATALVKKIDGKRVHSPPEILKFFKFQIRNDTLLLMAYWAIGSYISSMEIQNLLGDTPVVMDRYWHSHAARAIATAVVEYPEKYTFPLEGDKVYNWPHDLPKPDIVILLDLDEDQRQLRLEKRRELEKTPADTSHLTPTKEHTQTMVAAYKRMSNPSVIVINATGTVEENLSKIYSKVKPLFKDV